MMTLTYPYGHSIQTANGQPVHQVHQVHSKSLPNPVELSVHAPIASPLLHELVSPSNQVVILVSDITRSCPTAHILPYILNELKKAGVPGSQIKIIVGTGLHRKNSPEEIEQITGMDIYQNYTVLNTDPNQTVYAGTTSYGTPVEVFEPVFDADFRIAIGAIELHYFAGFTGGYKAVLAGVCSSNTIRANHSMMHHHSARAGVLESNPVRQDMDELHSIVPLHFIVNVILDASHNVISAVAGHPIHAHKHGCSIVKYLRQKEINQLADIVIVSAGGYPKDINLYQAQKALDSAVNAVKQDGIVILIAECKEGFGNLNFESWLLSKTHDQIKEDIVNQFVVGGHKAAALVKALEKTQIWLVSSLPKDKVYQCKMRPFDSVETAIQQAFETKGSGALVTSIPDGTSVYPVFVQQ